ncbi:hypothetical protein E5Q_04852 [Mixia osmundae IAM 14324]|uniref:Major facilitator superfamily (MFS) profile domain-containing protein n=2 Tax=Mixia osmundae (strain CBS 9802 / IAM 14324 / JCM 22182 / KY 12970) TaxID=764103 RepID=G7E5Q9_MIXOS|nr:hypothetical protein E5Q_04852 [Mixia osmundae IAM 14324]
MASRKTSLSSVDTAIEHDKRASREEMTQSDAIPRTDTTSTAATSSPPANAEKPRNDLRQSSEERSDGLTSKDNYLEAGKEGHVVVDWIDGENDPGNPRGWCHSKKVWATVIVSAFTFTSPLSSSMMAPTTPQLVAKFGITSSVVEQMLTSIFILGYAFGPLIAAPLSEIFGRVIVLQLANAFFFVFNLACWGAPNTATFIIFRFLAGLGGSAPLAIGGGVLGDVWPPAKRGQAVAVYSLAPLLGPVIGPIAGSWVQEKSSYKWVFISTAVLDIIVQGAGLLFLRESYPPVLLGWRAAKMRKETGNADIVTVFDKQGRSHATIIKNALTRPFLFIFTELIIVTLGSYMALIYGTIYLILTTIYSNFTDKYGFSPGIAGLNYIALGVGLTGWSQIQARLIDPAYKRLTKRNGGVGRPEFRLPFLIPSSIFLPAGLLIYGWTAQYRVFWLVPDIGIALVGCGMIGSFQSIQLYILDTFGIHAASALAAVAFMRSIAGFALPLAAPKLYGNLGLGGGNSLLAGIAIALGIPAAPLLFIYGERIRKMSRYAGGRA